jgi:AcrR family transcriptional regulator
MERFVGATASLLAERSFDDITVADIVGRAGRTVGSFYARFDDKYAVLLELVDRTYARITAVVRAFCDPVRWEGQSLGDFTGESVRLNVQAYRRSASLFRASLTAAATDERFRTRRIEVMRFCAEQQKRFVLTRREEVGAADPGRASDRAFELVVATLDQALLFGRFTSTSPASDQALVRDLTDQCLRVLEVARPAPV